MRVVGVRLLAALPATVGTVDIVAATAPHDSGRVYRHAANLLAGGHMPRPQALTIGLVLLILAHGVATRRRLALQLAIVALVLAALGAMPSRPVRGALIGALLVAPV